MLCAGLFAQNPTFGIRGGINVATFNLSAIGNGAIVSHGSNSITSFNLGIFEDFAFRKTGFSFQPALYYTGKGGDFIYSDNTGSIVLSEKLGYLELPADLVGHIKVGIGEIYVGAGPYFARGISGTINGTLNDTNGETGAISGNVKYGSSSDDNLSAMQYGLDLIAGFELKNHLMIHLSYDIGLSNDVPSGNTSGGTNNSDVFSVSLGYAFK